MLKLARSAWIVAAGAPLVALAFAAVSACVGDDATPAGPAPGEDGAITQDGPTADGMAPPSDAGVDATGAGPCLPFGAFGDPVEVPGLHVAGASETFVRFSDDGLSALITRDESDSGALYLSDRAGLDVDFTSGTKLPSEVNGDGGSKPPGPATFADAKKTIYFDARVSVQNNLDILSATRGSAASSSFSERALVSGLSGFGDHAKPYFVNSNMYAFFNTGIAGTPPAGVHVFERNASGTFGMATPLVNLESYSYPVVTRDELTIFVSQANAPSRIYEASRSKPTVAFGVPVELPPVVSTGHETVSDVSVDACTLYFTRITGTESKLFKTTRAK